MNQTLHFTHLFSFSSMYSWSETSGSWTTLTLTGLELCRSLLTSWTLRSWLQISPVTCKKGGLKHVRHIKKKKSGRDWLWSFLPLELCLTFHHLPHLLLWSQEAPKANHNLQTGITWTHNSYCCRLFTQRKTALTTFYRFLPDSQLYSWPGSSWWLVLSDPVALLACRLPRTNEKTAALCSGGWLLWWAEPLQRGPILGPSVWNLRMWVKRVQKVQLKSTFRVWALLSPHDQEVAQQTTTCLVVGRFSTKTKP